MTADDHWAEADRLWRAVRRDLTAAIFERAGYQEGHAFSRLAKNWGQLCALDLDVAACLYHGVKQIQMMMVRLDQPYSPASHMIRQLGEVAARQEANPDDEVEASGELYALGQQALRDEAGRDAGGEL